MALHPRVVYKRRETITALPLYHFGYLQKKHQKDKDFKRFYAELRGTTLFLYKDDTQDTYTEKVELELLKSMELDSPYKKKTPTIFNLSLHTDKLQLRMDNADIAELWRGYILTVVNKEIPSKLQLLPGHMAMLQEMVEEEKRRNSPLSRPPLPPRPAFLQTLSEEGCSAPGKDQQDHTCLEIPDCFFDVTREEARRMLEANPECGNIIMRRSTQVNSYAVTIRQTTSSGPLIKNFRVSSTSSGFVIELDKAVTVPTLNDVVTHFLQMTEYRLQPYKASQPYDTLLDATPASNSISITSTRAKMVPQVQVAPMQRSASREEFRPPRVEPDGGFYMKPDEEEPDEPNARLAHFKGELKTAMKHRRALIYGAPPSAEENAYERPPRANSPSSTFWAV